MFVKLNSSYEIKCCAFHVDFIAQIMALNPGINDEANRFKF